MGICELPLPVITHSETDLKVRHKHRAKVLIPPQKDNKFSAYVRISRRITTRVLKKSSRLKFLFYMR